MKPGGCCTYMMVCEQVWQDPERERAYIFSGAPGGGAPPSPTVPPPALLAHACISINIGSQLRSS